MKTKMVKSIGRSRIMETIKGRKRVTTTFLRMGHLVPLPLWQVDIQGEGSFQVHGVSVVEAEYNAIRHLEADCITTVGRA